MSEEKIFRFFCENCNYGTNFQSEYKRHIEGNKHLTGKRKERIDKNKNRVEDKIKYECKICNITFNHITNYKCHNLNNHSTIEIRKKEFPFYCIECDVGTFSKAKFDSHCQTKIHINKSMLNNV